MFSLPVHIWLEEEEKKAEEYGSETCVMFIFMYCLHHGVAMNSTQCNERGKVCKVLVVQKWGLIITIRVIILITRLHIAFGIWFSVNVSVVDQMHSMKCQNKEENKCETCWNWSNVWTSLRSFQAMPKLCCGERKFLFTLRMATSKKYSSSHHLHCAPTNIAIKKPKNILPEIWIKQYWL